MRRIQSIQGRYPFKQVTSDTMYDLLSGALGGDDRLRRLPFSHWVSDAADARPILSACGITPAVLARAKAPVVLADIVATGLTFHWLYALIRTWVSS